MNNPNEISARSCTDEELSALQWALGEAAQIATKRLEKRVTTYGEAPSEYGRKLRILGEFLVQVIAMRVDKAEHDKEIRFANLVGRSSANE